MKIGDKLILHSVMFPAMMREGDKPDTFVAIEVIEEKEVPGLWGQTGEMYKGYRAIGDDGRHYLCNWHRLPDDSSTPMWIWNLDKEYNSKTDKDNVMDWEWYDVTIAVSFIPFKPSFVMKYRDIVQWCPVHKRLFYLWNPCFFCKHCPEAGLPPKDYSWNGWL